MHRSHGLQGSLKRRYKHSSPTSINGYHTAKKLLSQSPAKRPTFAFALESGYTLGSSQRIAHNGSHGETRAFRMGVVSLPSERFTRFGNPAWPGIRTANFAAFGSWPGGLPKNAESLRDSDALMRVAVPQASRPRRAARSFPFLSKLRLVHTRLSEKNRTQGYTRRNRWRFGWGRYHYPRHELHVHEHPRAGYQNGKLCRFWVLVGGAPEERREPSGQRCAYACRCPEASQPRWAT